MRETGKKRISGFHTTRAFPTFAPAILRPRSTTDSIGVSEALDSGSIPDAATRLKMPLSWMLRGIFVFQPFPIDALYVSSQKSVKKGHFIFTGRLPFQV